MFLFLQCAGVCIPFCTGPLAQHCCVFACMFFAFGCTDLCLSVARLEMNRQVMLVKNPLQLFRNTCNVGDDKVFVVLKKQHVHLCSSHP